VAIELETESPPGPLSTLGPYRETDYWQLPDEPRCELLYGRLVVTPSPAPLHQRVAMRLARLLDDCARQQGGEAFFAPLDVRLADHSVVQPDLLYISAERRHVLKDRVFGAPDLLVEILSPSSVRRDRGEKLRLYAESGVAELWLVDPAAQTVEFLANRDGAFVVRLPVDGIYRSQAIPGLAIDLDAFWRDLPA
jgi:Uma2 family endonuclease